MTSSHDRHDRSSRCCSAACSAQILPSPLPYPSSRLSSAWQRYVGTHYAICSARLRQTEIGAGEGNRTLVISLEGCCSTIELHPPHSIAFSQLPLPPDGLARRCCALDLRPASPCGLCRAVSTAAQRRLVGEVGLEPTKAKPADLQSAPFAARDNPTMINFPYSTNWLSLITGRRKSIAHPYGSERKIASGKSRRGSRVMGRLELSVNRLLPRKSP